MKVTVADVNKVLASVSKICECGNKVVFDEDGSYIEDKRTKQRTPIHKRNSVYVMELKVWNDSKDKRATIGGVEDEAGASHPEARGSSEQVFRRLGPDLI